MPSHKFVQVATGDYHSLAIDDEGKLWSWGRNDYKQLGDGTTENKKEPVQVYGFLEKKKKILVILNIEWIHLN